MTRTPTIYTDADRTAIYACGYTRASAARDLRRECRAGLVTDDGFVALPATARLVRLVRERGGDVAWDSRPDGVQDVYLSTVGA